MVTSLGTPAFITVVSEYEFEWHTTNVRFEIAELNNIVLERSS